MSLDPERFASMVAKAIDVATAPFKAGILELSARNAELTARLMELEKASAIPGRDGQDGAVGPEGPQGQEGPAGPAGPIGPKGEDGAPGEIGPVGPEGPQGRDGRDGQPGVPGGQGQKGDIGPAGRDGIDGKDGINGKDGTLERVKFVQQPDFRTIHVCRKDTEEVMDVWTFPVVLDRGVYESGKSYEAGDAVTYGGHLWIAQVQTSAQPTEFAKSGQNPWRLAVSRGKQGKEGPRGPEGAQGKQGPQGPQGRQGY